MSDKYIIKNCPCYIDMPLYNHDKVCRLGDIVKPNHKELYVYCQDCTDCVMKQIVEKCKEKYDYCFNKCKQSADEDIDCIECREGGQAELSAYFLSLLQIEEVE